MSANGAKREWQATKLGIVGIGTTLNTAAMQKAIDVVAKRGGRAIVFDEGRYLTGAITLKSGVMFHLKRGAVILGSTNPRDYYIKEVEEGRQEKGDHQKDKSSTSDVKSRNDNSHLALISAFRAEGIGVCGEGTVNGQGTQLALNIDSLHHTGEWIDPNYNTRRQRPNETMRPKLFFLDECSGISICGVHLEGSACWGLSMERCNNVVLRNLDIFNRAYWNNDGIDVSDSRDVVIKHCKINSADDGICLKSYHVDDVSDSICIDSCSIESSASAVKFGTASWGTFRNITIRNINVRNTFRSAIAIESVDGAQIENILVENITAQNVGNAIFLRLGQRSGDRKGCLRNVILRNINAEIAFGRPDIDYDLRGPEPNFFHNPLPSVIAGIPENRICDVILEDITISCPGRASKAMVYIPL